LEKQRVLVVAAPFAFLRRVMGAGVVLVLEDGFSTGARAREHREHSEFMSVIKIHNVRDVSYYFKSNLNMKLLMLFIFSKIFKQ
jgi:hypothetical protein